MEPKICETCGQELPSNITPRPDCPVCGKIASRMASINGQDQYMCTNHECPNQFKKVTMNAGTETTPASSS